MLGIGLPFIALMLQTAFQMMLLNELNIEKATEENSTQSKMNLAQILTQADL
jgi:hypothetical protein